MTDKNLAIRLSIDGAAKVIRDLKDVGGIGGKAIARITEVCAPAGRALQAISNAAASVRGRLEDMAGRLGAFGTAMMAIGPVGLAAAAALAAIGTAGAFAMVGLRKALSITDVALEKFGALTDQADQLGVSAEKLQAINFGAMQFGLTAEDTTKALAKLNDSLGDVIRAGGKAPEALATAFQALKISRSEIVKSGGSLQVMLPRIADGLARIKDQSVRTSVATALFGKAGAKLLPMLQGGSAGMKEFEAAARASGAVLSNAYVANLDDAGDKLAQFRQVNETAMGVIGTHFAGVSLKIEEFRTKIWQAVAGWVERSGIGEAVARVLDRVAAAVEKMIAKFGGVDAVFDRVRDQLAKLAEAFVGQIADVDDFAAKIADKIPDAIGFFRDMATVVESLASALRTLVGIGEQLGGVVDKLRRLTGFGNVDFSNWDLTRQFKFEPGPTAKWLSNQARGLMGGPQQTAVPAGPQAPLATFSAPSAAPALAPARPSAVKQQQPFGPYQIGGALDVNIKSPLPVKVRAKPVDPHIPINVNQGMNLGTP